MKLICPYCSNKFDLAEAARTEVLIKLAEALNKFGEHKPLVCEYSGAFATQRLGVIAPAKRLRIVTELLRLWESGIFQVQGKRYKIDLAGIVAGMRTVCDLEKYGFKNHNYLKRVLVADAERVSAEGLTAGEEKQRDEGRKGRGTKGRRTTDENETMSPEAQKAFKEKLGVSSFKELIGPKAGRKEERGKRKEDG